MQIKNETDRRALTRSAVLLRSSLGYLGQPYREGYGLDVHSPRLSFKGNVEEGHWWEQCMTALIQDLEQGILVADGQGRVIKVNSQAEEILGLPGSQVVGRTLQQVWEERELPALPFSSFEYRGRVLQGHEILVRDGLRFGSGSIRVLCDVTRLVKMEDQLKRKQRAQKVGEMVGCVAHEIRNPLASIELLASLMGASTQNDGERHRLAEQISMVVKTLDQLLSNLLVISGPPTPRIQMISIGKLIKEAILMAMPSIREQGVVIQEHVNSEAQMIQGDELMVRQSLLNILLNAIQASSKAGRIEIRSDFMPVEHQRISKRHVPGKKRPSPLLALTVRDFGSGISIEDQSRLFDPFFSRRKGGTGLGLAIVRQVMDIHGGWIRCESQIGEGTTFQLCFPQGRNSE